MNTQSPFNLPIERYDGQYGTEYRIWTLAALQQHARPIGLKPRGMKRLISHLAVGKIAGSCNLTQLGYLAPYWPMVWVLSPTEASKPIFPDAVLVWVDATGSHASPDEMKPRKMDFMPTMAEIEERKSWFTQSALNRHDTEFRGHDGPAIRQFNYRLLVDFRMHYTSGMAS